MSEPINIIKDRFNSRVSEIEKQFGIVVDFSPASIAKLETTFDEVYPLGTAPHPDTVIMAGYYVGEVFIQNIIGAAWDDTVFEHDPFTISLTIKDHILIVNPMEMICDYIRHPVNSMSRLFQLFSEAACGDRIIDENGNINGKQLAGVGTYMIGG